MVKWIQIQEDQVNLTWTAFYNREIQVQEPLVVYFFLLKWIYPLIPTGPSWSWSYGSWIHNYLCNQCLSPLKLWVWILLKQGVLNTTLCHKVSQWLATCRWFSLGTPVSSTNKTDRHDITEILLKVALSTINQSTTHILFYNFRRVHR